MVGMDDGVNFSKIDRVLVCQNFFNRWSQAVLRALPREKSDHCPLLLSLVDTNFGPKPFRWYNSWLERDGCEALIINVLDNEVYEGSPGCVITSKFKACREALKSWRLEMINKESADLKSM